MPSKIKRNIKIIVLIIIIFMLVFGITMCAVKSESFRRFRTDLKSEFNGLERTITVYTADGEIIAEYKGRIDIEESDGKVLFDYNGKRYIYYNCFVESIADIE